MKSSNTKFTTDELKQIIVKLYPTLDIKKLKRTGKTGSTIIHRQFEYNGSWINVHTNKSDNEIRRIEFSTHIPNSTDYINPNTPDDITGYEFVLMYDTAYNGIGLFVMPIPYDDDYRGLGMEKFLTKYNFENEMENSFLSEMDRTEADKLYPIIRAELESIGGKFSSKLLGECGENADWVAFTTTNVVEKEHKNIISYEDFYHNDATHTQIVSKIAEKLTNENLIDDNVSVYRNIQAGTKSILFTIQYNDKLDDTPRLSHYIEINELLSRNCGHFAYDYIMEKFNETLPSIRVMIEDGRKNYAEALIKREKRKLLMEEKRTKFKEDMLNLQKLCDETGFPMELASMPLLGGPSDTYIKKITKFLESIKK